MLRLAEGRKSCLVFCAGVAHAETVLNLLREAGEDADLVTGDTLLPIRDEIIGRFKAGRLRWLVNVTVLTVGFDAPNVDCVAILRATLSPGLFYQMVGRGFRLAEGKQDCLVLDFGSNLDVHGPVDQIIAKDARRPGEAGEAVVKKCPQCGDICFASIRFCPGCGHEFFTPKPRHDPTATDAAVLSSEVQVEEADVASVTYSKHVKRASSMEEMDNPKPPTMRVDYHIGNMLTVSEWVCIEHEGFALAKAHLWWSARTHEAFPESVVEAVQMCKAGLVGQPTRIRYRTKPGSKWPEIVGFEGIEKPEVDPEFIPNFEEQEVPF
jgi:DNA repair protein RadD